MFRYEIYDSMQVTKIGPKSLNNLTPNYVSFRLIENSVHNIAGLRFSDTDLLVCVCVYILL